MHAMAPPSLRRHSLPLAIVLVALISPTLLPSIGGTTTSGSHDLVMLDRFHRWMSAHGRSYQSINEKLWRLEVYRRNVEFIEASNRNAEALGYELGENEFTDLTNEEFAAKYASGTGPPPPEDDVIVAGDDEDVIITTLAGNVTEGRSNGAPPVSFDWRKKGAVTPVKHQGSICGSCWAFTAVATVESQVLIKGGPALDLSEQELIDCDKAQLNCKGGWTNKALEWIKAKGGLVSDAAYPYEQKVGPCKNMNGVKRAGKITAVRRVPSRSEAALVNAVLQTPVSISIDASGSVLQHYKTGVYKGPCTKRVNHAVTLVGWGVDNTGVKYWIAKNSWGSGWGQKGFFFMRKEADGPSGLCGITHNPSYYPVI